METTEHITESYVRYVKKWLTISNVKCNHGKEIDIIAFDTLEKMFYHIECGVTFKKNFALKSKPDKNEYDQITKKYRRRNSVDFYIDKKFDDNDVKKKFRELKFGKAKRIIVCWDVRDSSVIDYAKSKKIEIWLMKNFIQEFSGKLKMDEQYHVDDILRTIQLLEKSR